MIAPKNCSINPVNLRKTLLNSLPTEIDAWVSTRTPMAACSRREIWLPDFHTYAVTVTSPGAPQAEATRIVGAFLRDVMKLNANVIEIFVWLVPTKHHPTAWTLSLRPLTASGWSALSPTMFTFRGMDASW